MCSSGTDETIRRLVETYGLHRDFSDVVISAHVDDNKPEPRPLQLAIMFFLRGITTEKGREYIDGNILKGIE